ncbi:MAG TPA: DUF192 domain-containing protein [Rhodospirillales bacterium]|nr:DUF192 domain-containing protein [Rhodospirillales bacterium]
MRLNFELRPGGLFFLLMAIIGLLNTGAVAQNAITFERSGLVLISESGRHNFTVEMAITNNQRRQGLMYRRAMAADAGMLFDYGRPRMISMWMKNTLIPLDMIFIAANGRIASIARNTTPHSLQSINSTGPVRAVLEVNAGTAMRLNLEIGDRVEHDIFSSD